DCCARSRILVQRSVYDRFMELLEPAVQRVVVGDPRSRETEMGPLVSGTHRDKVASYVPDDDAVALANDTDYGLSGSIWTDDLSRALRVSRAVEAGNLSVNSHSSVRFNT